MSKSDSYGSLASARALKEVHLELINFFLLCTGFALLAYGVWGLFIDRIGIQKLTLCFIVAILLILLGTIDRFESIKGLGIEAKTRRLDQAIDTAKEFISKLRDLAEISGKTILTMNNKAWGTPASPTTVDEYDTSRDILKALKAAEVESNKIKEIMGIWAESAASRAVSHVGVSVYNLMLQKYPAQAGAIEQELGSIILPFHIKRYSPERALDRLVGLQTQADTMNIVSIPVGALGTECRPLITLWIEEIRYLSEYQDFRSRENWQSVSNYTNGA